MTLAANGPSRRRIALASAAVAVVIAVGGGLVFAHFRPDPREANYLAARKTLRALVTAQALFREGDADRGKKLEYASGFEPLVAAGLVDPVLLSGVKDGYRFRILGGGQLEWSATADPLEPAPPVSALPQYLFIDESGRIRYEKDRPASATSTSESF